MSMYRVLKMSGKYYACEVFLDDPKHVEAITQWVFGGTPVLLVDDLEGAADLLGISVEEIESEE